MQAPMKKKKIALVAGGYSGEYVISVQSARMIRENLDKQLFAVYPVFIQEKKWVYVDEDEQEYPVDKNDFTISPKGVKIEFDCALITIHGTPGEDGKLQGYFDLIGIPYTTAGVLASALTFNKYYCNLVVSSLGFPVARSVLLAERNHADRGAILAKVDLPVFVKPNKGGSSLGTTFVTDGETLPSAIASAFDHDDEVLVEEYLEGVELTCGVFRSEGRIRVLPVTEIISKTEARFFDYKAKYTPGAADEITPARIPDSLTSQVQREAARIYEALNMSGLTRVDFIYSSDRLFFLEINVTPGMSETSIVPQQAEVEGISSTELFTLLIREALSGS